MAIYDFLHEVITSVNKRKIAISFYMDMAKAFDHVNHDLLLQKFYKI